MPILLIVQRRASQVSNLVAAIADMADDKRKMSVDNEFFS